MATKSEGSNQGKTYTQAPLSLSPLDQAERVMRIESQIMENGKQIRLIHWHAQLADIKDILLHVPVYPS